MSKGMVEPGGWLVVVDHIGLGGTVILILAIGVGTGLCWKLPQTLDAFHRILKTILKYQREKKRIPNQVKAKQANLNNAIGAAKRNGKKGGAGK